MAALKTGDAFRIRSGGGGGYGSPLERPADVSSFVITREQAAQMQARILAKSEDLSRPAEPSVYFWDRGIEAIGGEYRSSIITDPADGKKPP